MNHVLISFLNFPTISSTLNLTIFLLQTLLFCITVLVKDPPAFSASSFRFRSIQEVENAGIDHYEDDLLHNFVTKDSQLMNGAIPWRGKKEKDLLLLQMLIEACTDVGDIVVDCTAATGDSLPLCFMIFILDF
jgi:hypothetical protein